MLKHSFKMLLVIAVLAVTKAHAQAPDATSSPLTDQFGKPFTATKYNLVEGTPYLFDQWVPGKAITDDGKVYDNLKLKYDVYNDVISFIYLNTDEPLKFEESVKTFTIESAPAMKFVNGFPKIDRQNEGSYYQQLVTGKALLLKRYFKTIKESRNYSMAATNGIYSNGVVYYAFKDHKMIHFKASKDGVLKLMSDKAPQIADYLAKQPVDFKDDADVANLFAYYNRLP